DILVNGFSVRLGPLRLKLTELVRSFPSLYELLPTYSCLDLGDGEMRYIIDAALPEVDAKRARAAATFHQRIAAEVVPGQVAVTAVKGGLQPTPQSARLVNGRIELHNVRKGFDHSGDGTVPRPSAHPPEWGNDDVQAIFAPQKHGSLQNTLSVQT